MNRCCGHDNPPPRAEPTFRTRRWRAGRGGCIVDPPMASSRRLAAWYFQLAQLLEAGVPLPEALAAPGGPSPRLQDASVRRLRAGSALDAELAELRWLPPVDGALLRAGAAAGRLPAVCRQLATHHEGVARLATRAALATLYPLAVVHLGAFALPLRHLVLGSAAEYARQVVYVLVPLWLVLAALGIVFNRHASVRRRVLAVLPLASGYQRARDLGVLATVLEGHVANGLSPVAAWAAAGRATGAPALAALGARMAAEAEAGRPPGLALLREAAVPAEFARTYRSGEQSGRLDESLAWLARRQQEEAERKLTLVSIWYPQGALLLVAVWVGVNVVLMYAGYLRELLQLME